VIVDGYVTLWNYGFDKKFSLTFNFIYIPQFRSIIPCEVLLYIEVIFWD